MKIITIEKIDIDPPNTTNSHGLLINVHLNGKATDYEMTTLANELIEKEFTLKYERIAIVFWQQTPTKLRLKNIEKWRG
jgi:hypothetical protein